MNGLMVMALLVAVVLSSVVVHESVHWIQLSLDPDLKPARIVAVPAGTVEPFLNQSLIVPTLAVEAAPRRPMEQAELFMIVESRRPLMEFGAYAVQAAYMAALAFAVVWKHWRG